MSSPSGDPGPEPPSGGVPEPLADPGSADITSRPKSALEALLLVVDEPAPVETLAAAVGLDPAAVTALLTELAEEYTRDDRGFDLRTVGGGWRLYTRAGYAPVVERFLKDERQARLSQPALETLAVIAYRQPVTRSRIAAIRGVNVDGVVRTLQLRGLVEETGVEKETGAVLYRTTPYFLERFGLDSLAELPTLADYLPEPHLLDVDEA